MISRIVYYWVFDQKPFEDQIKFPSFATMCLYLSPGNFHLKLRLFFEELGLLLHAGIRLRAFKLATSFFRASPGLGLT